MPDILNRAHIEGGVTGPIILS